MTLSLRNRVFFFAIIATAIALGLAIIESLITLRMFPSFLESLNLGNSKLPAGGQINLAVLAETVLSCALALGVSIGAYSSFRKTQSPEAFFFTAFAASLGAEFIRMLIPMLVANDYLQTYGIICTKFLYFARFFGIFCLVTGSLFAHGVQEKKIGSIAGVLFIAAALMASQMPIANDVLEPYYLFRVGDQDLLLTIYCVLGLMCLVNYAIAWAIKGSREYAFMLLSTICLIAGRELCFWMPHPLAVPVGIALMTVGSWTFLRTTHGLYLWA